MTEKQFQRKLKKMQKEGERYKQIKELSDAYAEYFPEKKEKKVSNIMLVVSVIAVLSYVVAAFWIQLMTGAEISPTVTTLYFSFWTIEVWNMSRIKINKIKNNSNITDTIINDFVDGNGING